MMRWQWLETTYRANVMEEGFGGVARGQEHHGRRSTRSLNRRFWVLLSLVADFDIV
jgi:hypothetical protein